MARFQRTHDGWRYFVPDELLNAVLGSGLVIQHGDANLKCHLLKIQVGLSNQYFRPKLVFRFDAFDYQGQPVVVLRLAGGGRSALPHAMLHAVQD